jgi:hypothetical protein
MSMPLAQLICIQRSATSSDCRTNRRAFLASAQGADAGTGSGCASNRELVTMLLPVSPAMTMAMMTDRSCRCNRSRRKSEYQHYQYDG